MMTITQLLEALTQERSLFFDAIKNIPDTTLARKGTVGEWSMKDVIGHLASWEYIVAGFLPERLKTGIMPEVLLRISTDEDGWNKQEVAAREHFSSQEQIADLQQSRLVLFQVLESLGEEALTRAHPWPQWQGTLGEYVLKALNEHDCEHREMILAALEQIQQ